MDSLAQMVDYVAQDRDEPIGDPITIPVDIDKSTVIYGNPGIYDGLTIAAWQDQGE
jgi:hypothetical protein